MADNIKSEILDRVLHAVDNARPVEGVLFHGTSEPTDDKLMPGGDDHLWFAFNPVIAQQYISASGLVSIVSKPSGWQLDEYVRPSNEFWRDLAETISGVRVTGIEYDRNGGVQSYTVPDCWPTYAQCVVHLEDVLGYRADAASGVYEVKIILENGRTVCRPCDYLMQGRLYMVLADGLDLIDLRNGSEPDLTERQWEAYPEFSKAAAQGHDGIITNDFCQTDHHGNFGHVSCALNPDALSKLDYIVIPARRFVLPSRYDVMPHMTDDLRQWAESIRPDLVPIP